MSGNRDMRNDLLAISSSENSQQRKEEVNNVQIQGNRGPNVFVVSIAFDQVVCIVYDVSTEYD